MLVFSVGVFFGIVFDRWLVNNVEVIEDDNKKEV